MHTNTGKRTDPICSVMCPRCSSRTHYKCLSYCYCCLSVCVCGSRVDIDECMESGSCQQGSECVNTDGSYYCQPQCLNDDSSAVSDSPAARRCPPNNTPGSLPHLAQQRVLLLSQVPSKPLTLVTLSMSLSLTVLGWHRLF